MTSDWEWPVVQSHEQHNDRGALLRPIPYELTAPLDQHPGGVREGHALSLNISSRGMLVLMEHPPALEQVLRVKVPTPLAWAETPTLAEVRWVRRVPFGQEPGMALVGLRFLF